jgi:polyadenylate-binding protein
LHPNTNEGDIYEHFKAYNIVSVKVCRDFQNGESLCYGYINFIDVPNAEKAITNENYSIIKTRECRLMWQQRDPTLRITSRNNLIVRNLGKEMTTQELSALFSGAGNIISCKINKNVKGVSEGFGFVQFSKEEEAAQAILMFNNKADVGKQYGDNEKPLLVDIFEKCDIRNKKDVFFNLYIKNLPDSWDEDSVNNYFSKYGTLTS